MAPADKSINHNRFSLPIKTLNMASPSPNLYPGPSAAATGAGNGPHDKTLNLPPPSNYNRNNSSLRQFCDWLDETEKNKHNASSSSAMPPSAMEIDRLDDDSILSKSEVLTREEVLERRSRNMKRLGKLYRDYYWMMMEELKHRHRDYYWEFGTSPFQDEEEGAAVPGAFSKDETNNKKKPVMGLNPNRCEFHSCKVKPMALTRFCFTHILSDQKQVLYKGCTYITKSLPTGPICCMKPVLRSMVPLLCPLHVGKAEKNFTKALRKAGHTVSSKGKSAPKIHVVLAEFVSHIKRRRHSKSVVEAVEIKEDKC